MRLSDNTMWLVVDADGQQSGVCTTGSHGDVQRLLALLDGQFSSYPLEGHIDLGDTPGDGPFCQQFEALTGKPAASSDHVQGLEPIVGPPYHPREQGQSCPMGPSITTLPWPRVAVNLAPIINYTTASAADRKWITAQQVLEGKLIISQHFLYPSYVADICAAASAGP